MFILAYNKSHRSEYHYVVLIFESWTADLELRKNLAHTLCNFSLSRSMATLAREASFFEQLIVELLRGFRQ